MIRYTIFSKFIFITFSIPICTEWKVFLYQCIFYLKSLLVVPRYLGGKKCYKDISRVLGESQVCWFVIPLAFRTVTNCQQSHTSMVFKRVFKRCNIAFAGTKLHLINIAHSTNFSIFIWFKIQCFGNRINCYVGWNIISK